MKLYFLLPALAFLVTTTGQSPDTACGTCSSPLCSDTVVGLTSPWLCRCDANCTVYGDCCSDRPQCSEEPANQPLDGLQCRLTEDVFLLESYDYDPASVGASADSYWMVSACPRDWLDGGDELRREVERNCSNDSTTLPPVSDLSTSLAYKNEYCAVCNGVQRLVQWQYGLGCTEWLSRELEAASLGLVIFELTLEVIARECLVCGYQPPSSNLSSNIRACYPHVDTCLPQDQLLNYATDTEGYEELVNQCRSGPMNLVTSQPGRAVYRNEHCALCNGVSETVCAPEPDAFPGPPSLSCEREAEKRLGNQLRPASTTPQPPSNSTHNIGGGIIGFPFSLVLDVSGSGVRVTTSTTSQSVSVTCGEGELYDPTQQSCRSTVCPEVFEGGGCEFPDSELTCPNATASCPTGLIQLTGQDMFDVLDNCTVRFDGEVYSVLYYEGEDPVICPDLDSNGTRIENVTVISFYSYPTAYFVLTYVGCSLSLAGAFIILLTLSLFKELRTLPTMILANLAFTILVSTFFILVGGPIAEATQSRGLCVSVAIILHLFFLAQFSWMTILSVEISLTLYRGIRLRRPPTAKRNRRTFALYLLLGWSIPAIIVVISVAVNFAPSTSHLVLYGRLEDGTDGLCWINHTNSAIVSFLVPIIISIVVNSILLLIITVVLMRALLNQIGLSTSNTPYAYIRVYAAVFFTSGVTWLFGFLALLLGKDWAWYPFIVLNSIQGLALCLAFLLTKKVAYSYLCLLSCGKLDYRESKVSSSGVGTASSGQNSRTNTPTHLVKYQVKREEEEVAMGDMNGKADNIAFKDEDSEHNL